MDIGLVLLLFVALIVAVIFMGFKVVPQGYEWKRSSAFWSL